MKAQHRTQLMAEWLLNRVAGGNTSESLVGDLVEEHHRGRSSLWFWTQVLAAMVIAAGHEIRAHRLAAISGIVTGFASLWCFAVIATRLLTSAGFPHAVNWRWPHMLVLFVIGFTYTILSGWIVGSVHRTHRTTAVFSFLASVLIVPVLELPLLYWLNRSVFSSLAPISLMLIATVIGAPVAILIGGFSDRPRVQKPV